MSFRQILVDVVLEADFVTTAGGRQGLVRRFITRTHLDSMYSFKAVIEGSSASHLGGQLQGGDLVVRGGPETLVNLYGWWRQGQLQTIALYHGITLRP